MQKVVHEVPKILQLSLQRKIEVPMTFFDPAVGSILAQEDQHTALLVLTKEDENSSTKFKTAVLKELEPKGRLSSMKEMLLKTLPHQLRILAKTSKDVIGNLSGMFTIPAQDVKDIGTIVSLHSFHENILQGKDDEFPLEHFVINLAVVTAAIFLLRRLNSLAENNTEDETNTCAMLFSSAPSARILSSTARAGTPALSIREYLATAAGIAGGSGSGGAA